MGDKGAEKGEKGRISATITPEKVASFSEMTNDDQKGAV